MMKLNDLAWQSRNLVLQQICSVLRTIHDERREK